MQDLSLNVLRLSKPSLVSTNQHYYAPDLSSSSALDAAQALDPLTNPVSTPIQLYGLSSCFTLPSSFGNIYLGETFSCFISVGNEGDVVVRDVGVKVEIQVGNNRMVLSDTVGTLGSSTTATPVTPNPALQPKRVSLIPGQTTSFLISHEIKDLGTHILVCSVHYTLAGERKYFRKFFKFQVLNPLAVKTKVHTVNNKEGEVVLMEVQVQNTTTTQLTFSQLKFEPSDVFMFTDLNTMDEQGVKKSIFESETLDIKETRQMLYLLTPKPGLEAQAKEKQELGKLDIVWRICMADIGKLQTAQLTRKLSVPTPFNVAVLSRPEEVYAEDVFSITFRVKNLLNDKARLSLVAVKNKMGSILIQGTSERMLGVLEKGAVKDVKVDFLGLYPGFYGVTGLRLVDRISGQEMDVDAGSVYIC